MSTSHNPQTYVLPIGTRVQIHPSMDAWMRGDRYGEVIGHSRKRTGAPACRIRMDKSGRTLLIATYMLTVVS